MTITFCLVPFIPLGVLREGSGFNHFPYFILNYENKLFYMKNCSCSWPISYDVTSLIHYFQGQGSNHAILKFVILSGAGFEMHRIFRTSNIIRK